jgi:hypothetical protein
VFGEEWEPAEGEVIDVRYGGKHGDCVPAKKKARFDRDDPAISKKAAERQHRAAYEAELHADIPDPGSRRPD